ncbi:hypothetical protein TRV_00646 [Trichophyton verrucosum HKI 0517]|uniref:Uncharacterized protein n=1 Tax=Trichophyton verrucosum (strain HKI 0517) TaxID=663202 RepID=D4D0Q1_TRIVH|nr:uncharacterized protein TRV_00646 [Trichophyton verrucosum HKI 0517]EFE44580.1 hypothetical protein TRV_00646 [Trichophyton verrucosum HKI 0517]
MFRLDGGGGGGDDDDDDDDDDGYMKMISKGQTGRKLSMK